MTQANLIIDTFDGEDELRVGRMRDWVRGHFDSPDSYDDSPGKLRVINTILDNNWIKSDETYKLQCLGIALGDALEQEIEDLRWVIVVDGQHRDPALRWQETEILVYPQTMISKRIEQGENVDVYALFGDTWAAIDQAVEAAG